jgi:EmrB/QacA subfamily drug resistance transporter
MAMVSSKRTVLLVAALGSFLTPFMGSSVNVALPSIGAEFSMDAVLLSWVATIYLLAAAMFLVPFGRLADIYGRKKMLTYGIIIYTLSSFLSAIAVSAFTLIIFRVLQGIGAALIFGTCIAILMSVYPIGERGKALGITIAAVYLGLSLGPFLGGLLTQSFGWRSIFFVNIPFGIVILGLIFCKLKEEWIGAGREKFDTIGSILFGLTLVAVMYGFSLLPVRTGLIMILVGISCLFTFVLWEKRVDSPVLNLRLFQKNMVFAFSNLAALINYSATFAVGFLLSLYLQYIKGFNPQNTGLILVSQPLVMTLFSPFAGKLSDRIEPRLVASVGMTLTAIGLSLLTLLGETTSVEYIIASLLLLGFSFALFSSPNANAIMSSVEKRFYGVASATLGTMRLIGQMLSMGIAMLIFALLIGRIQITPEYYPHFLQSIQLTFSIFVVMCICGVFASLARGKIR